MHRENFPTGSREILRDPVQKFHGIPWVGMGFFPRPVKFPRDDIRPQTKKNNTFLQLYYTIPHTLLPGDGIETRCSLSRVDLNSWDILIICSYGFRTESVRTILISSYGFRTNPYWTPYGFRSELLWVPARTDFVRKHWNEQASNSLGRGCSQPEAIRIPRFRTSPRS